jgi:hypothetical protein
VTGTVSDGGSSNDTTLTLAGTAEANATVSILDGATTLDTVIANGSGAWSFTTPELNDGGHSFTATAKDAAGNIGEASSAFSVTVDTRPSTPDLTAASDHGADNSDNITNVTTPVFTGTAQAGSTVKLLDGLVSIGSTTASSTDGTWTITSSPLSASTHQIRATATDGSHVSPFSSALAVTIDIATPPAPPVPVLSPASNSGSKSDSITNATTPTFTGSAEADSTVRLFDGATLLGSAVATSGNWSITAGTALGTGAHRIATTATDVAGNVSGFSPVLTVTIDKTAPAVPSTPDLTAASDSGASSTDNKTNANPTVFTGSAEAGSIVTLFDGGLQIGNATAASNGAWIFSVAALSEGSHTITAKATDAADNTSVTSGALSVTIDRSAPSIPAAPVLALASDSGASNSDGNTRVATPVFTGTAEAGSKVKLFDGTTQVGSVTAPLSGTWSITSSTLSNDSHAMRVTATDVAGNASNLSNALSVTIDSVAPGAPSPPALDNASNSGSTSDNVTHATTPSFSGAADNGSTVKLFDGVAQIGITTVSGGVWQVTPTTTLGDGTHQISATATDLAGNVSGFSGPSNVVIDTTPPAAPAIASLTSNGAGGATLAGTAEPGSTVTLFDLSSNLGTAAGVSALGDWSASVSDLSDTVHVFTAKATDVADNPGGSSGTAQLGSSGSDSLSGTAGIDDFTFLADFANDTINGFNATGVVHDIVNFHANPVLNSFASVLANASQIGGDVVISQGSSGILTLAGTQKTDLVASNFTFV